MLRRLLLTGILSGLIAGAVMMLLDMALTMPILADSDRYQPTTERSSTMEEERASPAFWDRGVDILEDDLLESLAFGLLMASGFTMVGGALSLRTGAIWGLAGFVSFWLMPGLGVPPALPGRAPSTDLFAIEAWEVFASLSAAIGLWLIIFRGRWLWRVAGLFVLALPQIFGAPQIGEATQSDIPVLLISRYVTASGATNLAMWITLGLAAAALFVRIGPTGRGSIVDFKV